MDGQEDAISSPYALEFDYFLATDCIFASVEWDGVIFVTNRQMDTSAIEIFDDYFQVGGG